MIKTQRPFVGRIFVKAHSRRTDCSRQYDSNSTMAEFSIALNTCGMIRERKV